MPVFLTFLNTGLEFRRGVTRGDSRSSASLRLIRRLILIECNRSSLVSLKFPFVLIVAAGTLVAL